MCSWFFRYLKQHKIIYRNKNPFPCDYNLTYNSFTIFNRHSVLKYVIVKNRLRFKKPNSDLKQNLFCK